MKGIPNHWTTLQKLIWLQALQGGGGGGELVTVTGVSPLLLVNALAHSIHSITQYGKCIQDGTPTPSAPQDIKCNNGALRMVDDELPSGYKRVLGFTCNNNAMWQITDFHLRGSDTVRISFSATQACNVFGCYQGADANDNYDLYVSTTAGSKYLRYGNGTYLSYWSSANLGERFDVVFTPTGTSGMPQDSTWTEKTFESANDLLIGSTTTTGTSSKLRGDLYGNIVVDGRLKLIPCERLSDNVLGYYDTYSETFYEPYTGFTGAVSLGYDGSHYSLQVVGTAEVMSVGGKNVSTYSKTLTVEGTSQGIVVPDENVSFVADGFKFEPNTRYTISLEVSAQDVTTNADGGLLIFYVDYSDGTSSTFGITKAVAEAGGRASWTTTSGKTVTDARRWIKAARWTGGYITISKMQIEMGTTATAYEPYVTPQTVTPVPNLLAVGNVKDELEIVSGLLTHKCGIYIFTGEENFGSSSAYGTALYINAFANTIKADKTVQPTCTHFATGAGTSTQPEGTCFFNTSGHFYFRTSESAPDFKTWLAGQYAAGTPVILVFARTEATQTTEQTTPHALNSYDGTTVVEVESPVGSVELSAEYMAGAA